MGRSGSSCKDFLLCNGAKVYTYIDGEKNKKINLEKLSFAIFSPGVSLDSDFSIELKRFGVPIISELELGYLNVNGNYIAVTGTNGKTTTVSLLYNILKENNKNTFLAGNIGTPLISLWDKTNLNSTVICEVSSYQLETCNLFKPKISAILNLAPDHLKRHKTYENYCKEKLKIFKNQTKNDYCVLNYDDKKLLKLAESCNAKKYYFSRINQFENSSFKGAYISENEIYFKDGFSNQFIMNLNDIQLVGEKNKENVLASITISMLLGTNCETIAKQISTFKPLEHRLEIVKTINNITYINDSKATNVASTLADVSAIDGKIVLLLGGSDKGENFKDLFNNLPKNVELAVLFGATKENMQECANLVGFKKIEVCNNLKQAVYAGNEYCKNSLNNEKVCLLLAPACASFDEFKNFEQRGDYFKNIINNGGLNW